MRTTVDIDRALLDRAKRTLKAKTYKEAIERSLEEAIARAEIRDVIDELEGSGLSWGSVDELVAWRRGHADRHVDLH